MTIVFVAALAATISPAQAEPKCGPLKLVNTVQLIRFSKTIDLVPITVSGEQKDFVFDTAGFYSQISRDAAAELNLKPHFNLQRSVIDFSGRGSAQTVTVPHFELGSQHVYNMDFVIAPNIEIQTWDGIDGLYAFDLMGNFDVDVDFGTDTLNFFSPDHCPGGILYWQAPALAVVPITLEGYHVVVPVTLDGHEFRAVVDTGNENTVLEMTKEDLQDVYGLTLDTPDTPRDALINGVTTAYRHTFKQLTFGDIAVSNPHVSIVARDTHDRNRTRKPEVTLGMDVLRKLHIYMAFNERKMYISPASAPAPAASASTPAPSP